MKKIRFARYIAPEKCPTENDICDGCKHCVGVNDNGGFVLCSYESDEDFQNDAHTD